MVPIYIALGSNVGERLDHFHDALRRLSPHLKLRAASYVYETAPMYVVDQPAFLNAAVCAESDLSPLDVLRLLKRTEKEVGRKDRDRYGPREVDLDLIVYGALAYRYLEGEKVVLHLPHPKTVERRFVLQPLYDLEPSLRLPGIGRVDDLLVQTADQEQDIVRRDDAVLSI